MTPKRLFLSFVIVFIAMAAVAGVLHVALVDPFIDDAGLGRAEEDEKILPYMLSRVLFVSLFVYIYARWYLPSRIVSRGARPGVPARLLLGLRYGLMIWLFYSIPMTAGFWAFLRMPNDLALSWVGIGLAEYLTGGLLLGLLGTPRLDSENASP